jgi:hypothetical protein
MALVACGATSQQGASVSPAARVVPPHDASAPSAPALAVAGDAPGGPVACTFGDLAGCVAGCAQGSRESCNNVGAHFELGRGVVADVQAARVYYALACDAHVAAGCTNLARVRTAGGGSVAQPAAQPCVADTPSLGFTDAELVDKARTLVSGLRLLVGIGRRDTRALEEGKTVTYATTPREVEGYVATQYAAARVTALAYQRELAARLHLGAPDPAPLQSARTVDGVERVADAVQALVEALDSHTARATAAPPR